MKQQVFSRLLTITLVLLTTRAQSADLVAEAAASGFSFDLTTTVGTQLDKLENKASVSLEPTLTFGFSGRRALEFYTALDRPFNQYEKVTVPKAVVTFSQGFDWISGVKTTATAAVSALSLDRWGTDGRMMRGSVGLSGSKEVLKGLTLALKVSPYGQLNEYRQSTGGRELAKYGLTEKITVEYVLGPVLFDLVVLFDQKRSAVWKNAYSTLEQVAFRVTDNWILGVSHELLGSAVDDSTGLFTPVQVFNERNSRVSAFVEFTL